MQSPDIAFILDIDGVLVRGHNALPCALPALKAIESALSLHRGRHRHGAPDANPDIRRLGRRCGAAPVSVYVFLERVREVV